MHFIAGYFEQEPLFFVDFEKQLLQSTRKHTLQTEIDLTKKFGIEKKRQ